MHGIFEKKPQKKTTTKKTRIKFVCLSRDFRPNRDIFTHEYSDVKEKIKRFECTILKINKLSFTCDLKDIQNILTAIKILFNIKNYIL